MAAEDTIITEVRKRDGRIVPFELGKITQAIFAAARAVGGDDYLLAEQLGGEVVHYLAAQKLPAVIPTVEEIQDVVEKVLIEKGHARTAKAYILYRAGRTRIREARSELMDVVKDILLEKHGDVLGEKEAISPAEKMQRIALAASQKYYLDNLLPAELAEAHLQGRLHIDQLGYYSKTFDSLQLDPYPLLRKSLSRDEKISTRDLLGSLIRVVAILQRSRNDLYGELAVPAFDLVMGRLLRSGGKKPGAQELSGALQGFLTCLHSLFPVRGSANLNCSIGLGLDTTEEGMMVTRLFLLQLGEKMLPREGPGCVFLLKKGVNMEAHDPGYPLYHLALQVARANGNIHFSFPRTPVDCAAEAEICYFSNGLRIAENRHGKGGGKGRGNIASVTINLPRLALTSGDEDIFFVELDRLLRLAARQLLHRFEVLAALYCRDLPFIMGSGLYRGSEHLAADERVRESLQNGILTLCFCGLRETVRYLSKGAEEDNERYQSLFLRILEHMQRRVESFAVEYDLNIFLCGAFDQVKTKPFIQVDRQEFGLIRGITDREYYSNGILLFQEDGGLDVKITLEGQLHRCCNGGYNSKAVLYPGLDTEAMMTFMSRLAHAGIGFLDLSQMGTLFLK